MVTNYILVCYKYRNVTPWLTFYYKERQRFVNTFMCWWGDKWTRWWVEDLATCSWPGSRKRVLILPFSSFFKRTQHPTFLSYHYPTSRASILGNPASHKQSNPKSCTIFQWNLKNTLPQPGWPVDERKSWVVDLGVISPPWGEGGLHAYSFI